MKQKPDDRFVVVYQQINGLKDNRITCRIFIDRVTGVNYLYSSWGYGGGLTPLLDANGKPIITPVEHL
jgi:hypothetical protein